MTNNSYFGGFLYHPETEKILLQQQNSVWTLIEIKDLLKIKVPKKAFRFIYDYFHESSKTTRQISYAEVKSLKVSNQSFAWFTFKEISKLNIAPEAKQDIIVGKRVIDSTIRRNAGEQTIG